MPAPKPLAVIKGHEDGVPASLVPTTIGNTPSSPGDDKWVGRGLRVADA